MEVFKRAVKVDDKYFYTIEKYPKAFTLLDEAVKKKNTLYQYRRVYVRENKSNECPTLTAKKAQVVIMFQLYCNKNRKYRKLTLKNVSSFKDMVI